MGTGSLLFGFLFLINPDYFTLDLFPDVFGYLLIAHGLYRLSFLEDRVWQGRRWARYLALISLVKLFTNFIAFTTSVESTRLTLVFLFAAVEGWMGFLLADNVFKGVQYLAVRQDSDLTLKGIDVCGVFARVFFIVKHVLSFLPASLILFFSDVDAQPDLVENYASLRRSYMTTRMVMMLLSFIGVLAFGILTFRVIAAYMKRVRSDGAFIERLKDLYRVKVLENENAMVRIHVSESFAFFGAAALFLPHLFVDNVDFIPTFIAPLLVYLGLRNLSKGVKTPRFLRVITLSGTVVGFASYVYRFVCVIILEEKFMNAFAVSVPAFLLGIAGQISLALAVGAMICAAWIVCRRETDLGYTLYAVFLTLMWLGVIGCGFYSYAYPGRNGIVQAVQIGLALVALYFHKKSLDQISAEVEWKRM